MNKLLFSLIALLLLSCVDNENLILTEKQKIELADKKFAGIEDVLQGSVEAMQLLEEVIALNPNHCAAIRELSIAYLKRGIPHQWKPIMDRAVACDPVTWQGWRGYLYLYFYRDYNKAIEDFNATDSLTPNYIDAPQGHSVDFWRGNAYFGLKDYPKAISYYEKHIAKVTEDFGEDWVEINAFLYQGIMYFEWNQLEKAEHHIDLALKYGEGKSAEAHYYKALIYTKKGMHSQALLHVEKADQRFKESYTNRRPYVEAIREIYQQEIDSLKIVLGG